ncbi:MAG TPA: hypothetical protein P5114_04215 [Hyphomicrobiaceae bacterium]|nr:hypothetical protein [Hyphomicrobiaceae bacterium]
MDVGRLIQHAPWARRFHARTSPASLAGSLFVILAGPVILAGGIADARGEEAKDSAPTWQSVLTLQLKDQHRCDLDKVLFERDVEVGASVSKEGRVRCLDGREFDFSRPSTHETFDIRLCQPTVC